MTYLELLKKKEDIRKQIIEKLNNILMLGISESTYHFISKKIKYVVSFDPKNEGEINFFLKKNDEDYSIYYLNYSFYRKNFSIETDVTNKGFEEEKVAILALFNILMSSDYFLNIIEENY